MDADKKKELASKIAARAGQNKKKVGKVEERKGGSNMLGFGGDEADGW